MDNTNTSTEIDSQLQKYREEQKRKHEQLARESTSDPSSVRHSPPSLRPTESLHTPSAPPLSEYSPSLDDPHVTESLYPSLNVAPSPLYPSVDSSVIQKAAQEEEDARLARELQQQEEIQGVHENDTNNRQNTPTVTHPPPVRYAAPSPTFDENPQIEDDEQLARAIQESEQAHQPAEAQQAPPSSGGILSTLTNLSRGLYNAYTTYSQAHQQVQHDAEQHAQAQNVQHQIQQRTRLQVEADEALARQIQEETNTTERTDVDIPADTYPSRPQAQIQIPTRTPSYQFRFRHAPANSFLSPFGYDSDEEDDPRLSGAQPLDHLRNMNLFLRSTGATPDAPIFQQLQELMQRTRNPSERFESALPPQRYVFPRSIFNVQGVEQLPPDLLNMMHGETDTSYESLLELAERMQPVSRGASTQQIDQLPTRTFSAGSMPAELSKCGICLSDYETGDELTSLPCLHSFHKDCISHWLGINKVCPVCRVEIAGVEAQPN